METDGDPAFHRSEAISAVQDVDQYYGDDDDFDDLYNDVNVADGFFNSSDKPLPPPPPPPQQHNQPHQLPPPQSPMAFPHSLPPPPPLAPSLLQQQPPIAIPHSLPPPPPLAPPLQQKVHIPGMAVPPPIIPPPQPNLPPPPQPPVAPAPPPPRHHPIQRGDGFQVGGSPGAMTLFVGDLHWWTTDADLEAEFSKYGLVKEVRFFDEKASGKSKGYCHVDFFDPNVISACKESMNGHLFHGRPCVVAFSSPNTLRRMGESHGKNNESMAVQTPPMQTKCGRGLGDTGGPQVGGNHSGGRLGGPGGGNCWRPGGGMVNRGPVGNMRNRMGPTGGRGIMGNGGMVAPPPPMPPPGGMMGQGFDPTCYGAMGAGFGSFPGGPGTGQFPGLMQPFPPVVALAPHVNPAFFGRGGMGPGGVGMWPNPTMGGWGGEEQASYGDDAATDQQYEEGVSHGKQRPSEREWSGAPERRQEREKDMPPAQNWAEKRHHDEKDMGRDRDRDHDRDRERDREREREKDWERDRHRDDRDRYSDHRRHRERDSDRNEDLNRGRSSGMRSRSREVDHSKRRRNDT